jgi:hypothetical protein
MKKKIGKIVINYHPKRDSKGSCHNSENRNKGKILLKIA